MSCRHFVFPIDRPSGIDSQSKSLKLLNITVFEWKTRGSSCRLNESIIFVLCFELNSFRYAHNSIKQFVIGWLQFESSSSLMVFIFDCNWSLSTKTTLRSHSCWEISKKWLVIGSGCLCVDLSILNLSILNLATFSGLARIGSESEARSHRLALIRLLRLLYS